MMPLKQLSQRNIINIKTTNKTNPNQNLDQSDFLSAICHDLKTPLSAIIGTSELLKTEQLDAKSIAEYITDINNSAAEMLDLVHDLLDAKQALSCDFSINKSEIDVANLINRSIRLNNNYASRRKIKITSEINNNITSVQSDAKRFKQILTNLISNSVKYSKENTEIKISAQKFQEDGAEFFEVVVSDQGLGMTEWQVAIALQKYRTIENDNTNTVDSFGLGLPIVKKLVELLGVEMNIKSEIHKGTDVRLVFAC